MQDFGMNPTGGAGSALAPDIAGLAEAVGAILEQSVNEHMQWNQGFFEWCNGQLMNFQPIPPQANMDFINRQNWILGYVKRFEAAGAILAKAGNRLLADRVDNYEDGLKKLLASFQSTQQNIAAGNAATQTKVGGIMDKMNADNLAASAARHGIQKQTFNTTFEMNSKAMADQRASFERMASKFTDDI